MIKSYSRRPALQNDLYIRSEELSGTPALDAGSSEETGKTADVMVRQLLVEEKRRTMPEHLPEILPQEEVASHDAQEPGLQRESARDSIAQILKAERADLGHRPEKRRAWLRLPHVGWPRMRLPVVRLPHFGRKEKPHTVHTDENVPPQARPRKSLSLPNWLRTYRPTRKHIAWMVVAALVLYRPLMVPLIALLLIWLVLIAYLTLGPDRWGEIIGSAWLRLHNKRPELAERVRKRADAFAEKFDRMLDRLPESWADRLALPDFSAVMDNDEDKPDPFERLAAEARQV